MKKTWTKVAAITLAFSLNLWQVPAFADDLNPNVTYVENAETEKVIYQDVEGHWAEEAIEALFNTGALRIPAEEPFGPDEPVTRAHFLYMLLTTKGITPNGTANQTQFVDVPKDAWYYPYVETAYQLGIITGSSAKYFNPEAPITKQEAIVMLIRSLGEGPAAEKNQNRSALANFKDSSSVASWADETMAYAVAKGFYKGSKTEQGLFIEPNKETTRGEAADLIYRSLYKRMENSQKEDVDGVPVLYAAKINVTATAYNKDEAGLSDHTALGWPVRVGVVAVDPDVIPYGTHLYIPGYGFAVAADRGSKVKNMKIDLYMDSRQKAIQFGRKENVTVYILDPIPLATQK